MLVKRTHKDGLHRTTTDGKTLIMIQKPLYQLRNKDLVSTLDQLVKVRILVPQVIIEKHYNEGS